MQELKVLRDKAIAAYNSNGTVKEVLGILFGKEVLCQEPMEWVKTFADVCAAAGEPEGKYAIPTSATTAGMVDAYWAQLQLIERVFNGDWVANIADTTQKKYYAWGNVIADASRPFGFRLSFDGYGCGLASSLLGARPEFKTSEIAIYVFKTFTSIYEGWMYYTYLSKQKIK